MIIAELRAGPYYIPLEGCIDGGCDFQLSTDICSGAVGDNNTYFYGGNTLATVRNARENQLIGKLLRPFGNFKPDDEDREYYWFYIGMKENKQGFGGSTYSWSDGSTADFTNWLV